MLNNHHTTSVPFFILFTLPFKQMSLLLILEFADCFQAVNRVQTRCRLNYVNQIIVPT